MSHYVWHVIAREAGNVLSSGMCSCSILIDEKEYCIHHSLHFARFAELALNFEEVAPAI